MIRFIYFGVFILSLFQKMSKIETDNFLMSSFSKEYKQVEDEVCREMNLNDSHSCTEDLHSFDLNEMSEEYIEDPVFLEEIKQLLSVSGLDALFAEREKEALEKKRSGKVKSHIITCESITIANSLIRSSTKTPNYSNHYQYKTFPISIRCRAYGVYSKANQLIMASP